MRRSEPAGPLWSSARRYLATIAVARRPFTVRVYRYCLTGFIRYLEALQPPVRRFADLRRCHIEAWLRSLLRYKLRAGTRRLQTIHVRRFLEDIAAWGWEDAPTLPLFGRQDVPPHDRCLPRALSIDADRALQKQLNRMEGRYPQALLLLRKTGLRVGELQNLEYDALKELPGGQWLLHVPLGKLHTERVIPVDASTAAIIETIKRIEGEYPPEPHPETGKPTRFLLVGRFGRRAPTSYRVIRDTLREAARLAGIAERVAPHVLRHSYATEMARAGMSLPVLKDILGHRTIRMTMRYVQVTQCDLQREYLATLEAIKERHRIPQPSGTQRQEAWASPRQDILSVLQTAASLIENLRRDTGEPITKKKLQRLVERLKRFSTDFHGLSS
jgi:site-specific recombinase XerD